MIKFKIGMSLEIKSFVRHRKIGTGLDIRDYKILDPDKEVQDLVIYFSGNIRVNNAGFGFVDNVFIHTSIIREHQLTHNDYVRGKAIRKFVDRENAWGWTCYFVDNS